MLGINKASFTFKQTTQPPANNNYVIMNGHPKKVYKKNSETGKLEFQYSVYDGSWGIEMSNEDIIALGQQFNQLG